MLKDFALWPQKLNDGRSLAQDFHKKYSAIFKKPFNKIAFFGMGGSGIAGRIVKKPVEVWRDGDFEPFQATIYDVANRIQSLILLIGNGLKVVSDENFVYSFILPNGRMNRRIISLKKHIKDKIKEDYKSIFDAPQNVKEALCAMLTMSLEDME